MSKPLDRLTLLETFVRIADAGSISAAARDLGLSQPSASRQLNELESRLRVQLLRRTTHSLALTHAGASLLHDARQLIKDWEALEEKHFESPGDIRGTVRVVAPIALGQQHLARIAWRFQINHPGIDISWRLEDQPIRFSEVGCDCWVKVGTVPDETLVVRRLGSVERALVAAPDLLSSHGKPRNPAAAEKLPFLALQPFEGNALPLTHRSKRQQTIRPATRLQTNNIVALKEAALMGLGLAVLPSWFVVDELARGTLVDALPTWRAPSLSINVAYLPGKHQTQRLKAFLLALKNEVPRIAGVAA
ncbi:MAG: LysR family transcriptional regulator [Pseudomonadota bacterium]